MRRVLRGAFDAWCCFNLSKVHARAPRKMVPKPAAEFLLAPAVSASWEWLAEYSGPRPPHSYGWEWIARPPGLWPHLRNCWDDLSGNPWPSRRLELELALRDLLAQAGEDTPKELASFFEGRELPTPRSGKFGRRGILSNLGLPWDPSNPRW